MNAVEAAKELNVNYNTIIYAIKTNKIKAKKSTKGISKTQYEIEKSEIERIKKEMKEKEN